jgi:hypothetical protein
MHSPTEYYLNLVSLPDPANFHAIAERVFHVVWRFDFTAPGFVLLDIGPDVDSHTLRSWMVALKERFSEIAIRGGGKPMLFRSMGRFDQQETTKFHLDGGPAESMLILGYEPSKIQSRLLLADYTHAAFDLGITPAKFLQDFNPMYKNGEEILGPYTTELPQPDQSHSRILLVNNSSLPFNEARMHPLGVMHKAIIVTPNKSERRIVNSTMLVTEGEEISLEKQREFVRTDKISQKNY